MSIYYATTSHQKNKHADPKLVEYIVDQVIGFKAQHQEAKRNIGKTEFMKNLAQEANLSLSAVYSIVRQARITVRDSHLVDPPVLSASAVNGKRKQVRKKGNRTKREKAAPFLSQVCSLLERKTRMYLTIPIKTKSAKQFYMKINQLEKQLGEDFSKVFQSITFDNGSEFARYADIEKKPGMNKIRAKVYFAHPYHSWERGSNENANPLLRRFYEKALTMERSPKKQFGR